MNKLIFDVETTGLPITKGFNKYYSPKYYNKYYNTSRLLEIAYIIFSENGEKLKEVSYIIKPDNFEINNSEFHGISLDKANKDGLEIKIFFKEFINDLIDVNTIIAHNINFDINIILSECFRYNNKKLINKLNLIKKECTMFMSKEKMNVYKSPKLIEAYKYFCNKDIIQEHRALSDVIYCSEIYYKIKN